MNTGVLAGEPSEGSYLTSAEANGKVPYGLMQQKEMNAKKQLLGLSDVPDGISLEQLKQMDANAEQLDIYLLQRNFKACVRIARMHALALELLGHPLSSAEITDVQELSRKV